MKIVLFIGL